MVAAGIRKNCEEGIVFELSLGWMKLGQVEMGTKLAFNRVKEDEIRVINLNPKMAEKKELHKTLKLLRKRKQAEAVGDNSAIT